MTYTREQLESLLALEDFHDIYAQADALRGEGVARAEKGPHVLQRTDVVEHHRDGHLLHRGELSGRGTPQLLVGDFSHNVFK